MFKDDELKRSAKAALLAQQNLERVTSIATLTDEEHPSASKAFAWLKAVCTTPSYGVLRQSGWYPSGATHLDRRRLNEDTIDLGLDSIEFYDRDDRPAVRNPILLSWVQSLHPWSNLQERELALACFRSAPELVAAYFVEKEKSMQLEPKLSNTWIGYASFLFEVVQLSVPERFGHGKEWAQLPPQTNVMIESILPRPLTQKVMSRCLNQSSELITFFAVRILVLAMQKLRKVQRMLADAAAASEQHAVLWKEASQRLLGRFVEQAPPVKDVMGTFRKIPDDEEHALQREAIARLLRLYYEVTPLQALDEQFDVSSALTAALGRAQDEEDRTEMAELRALELEHLLQVARHSPGMRWYGKQGGLQYSPITTLLRLHARDPRNMEMRKLITPVVCCDGQALNGARELEALLASFQEPIVRADAVAWEFLDDCLQRLSRKPVKYLDDLEAILDVDGKTFPVLLGAVMLEQAPYLVKKEGSQQAMRMVEVFLTLAGSDAGQDGSETAHARLLERIREVSGWVDQGLQTPAAVKKMASLLVEATPPSTGTANDAAPTTNDQQKDTAQPFEPPPTESENHPELLKWAQKDLDMALEDGDISALVFCLCSQHPDVRTQALAQLRKLEDRLINSTLEDKDPIYVLIGELIETYEQTYCLSEGGQPSRLEHTAGSFVSAALKVQVEPTHPVYPKLNRFLNKDPKWRVRKLPTYWIQNTILSMPNPSSLSSSLEDDAKAYWHEARWVLDWLVDGLRTAADLELLRRAGVFERFMALFCAPGVERAFKERVLELLWRASIIDGGKGAEMLVKRCGVLGWLDVVRPSRTGVEGWLRGEILGLVEGSVVKEWAGVGVGEM